MTVRKPFIHGIFGIYSRAIYIDAFDKHSDLMNSTSDSLPDSIPVAQAHALAAKIFNEAKQQLRQQHFQEAYSRFHGLLQAVKAGKFSPPPTQKRELEQLAWQVQPLWWAKLTHGIVSLRRCTAADAAFYQQCYQNKDFAQRFNRQNAWSGDLAQALNKYGNAAPAQVGLLLWIICVRDQPVGLASLSSIDQANSRAEFSIGIPGNPPPGVAHKASLIALHFAYFMLGLNKLYTYVYADNQKAIADTARLGFREEGILHEHFFLPPDGFVTVHSFGLTRRQAQENAALVRTVKRRINQDWLFSVKNKNGNTSQ